MIHLRPESTAYSRETAPVRSVAGSVTTPDNTVLEAQNPSSVVESLKTSVASVADSIKATLQQSIAAKALRGIEYMDMPAEPGFNVTKTLGDAVSQYNVDELEFLSDARSNQELRQRMTQVQSTRDNYTAMAANPLTSIGASMLDIDMVIGGGVGALSKLSRATRLAMGLAANSAVLGVASQGGTITPADVIGTSLGVALSAVPRVSRAVSATESAEQKAAQAATSADNVAQDTAQAASGPSVRGTVPDPDYKVPPMDFESIKPHVEVRRNNLNELNTDTANAVRAVTELGTDLTEGQRILGRALASSLESDASVPLRIRRPLASTERSNVTTTIDATGNATPRATIVARDGVAKDLSTQIKGMDSYQKAVILHEAAHAKTAQVFHAYRTGKLDVGSEQYAAVNRIEQLRQYVRDNTDLSKLSKTPDGPPGTGSYSVGYGLENNDEFISQMFNAPAFREHLQSIKMPDTGESLWTELVRRVVQAFTGQAPTGTAFDHSVSAFEELLNLPARADGISSVRVVESRAVPEVASPMLQAPNLQQAYNKTQGALNRNFSLYERIKGFGPKAADLADKLVVDSTGTEARSAAHYARTAELASNSAAVQVDAAFLQALKTDWPLTQRVRHPQRYKEAQRELSERVYRQLADNHERHLAGQTVLPNADPKVQSIADAFVESKWATDSLQRIKAAGVQGADDITESPYYLPRQHSGDRMSKFLRENPAVTRDDVIGMYSTQFENMFKGTGIDPTTARKLGGQMVRNMEQRASHLQGYRQTVAGMDYDDIQDILENLSVDDKAITAFMDAVKVSGEGQNTARNLRGRADFDMTADYRTKSGQLISPQLFVNSDTMALMEGYGRRMSGRIGLARAGYPDIKQLIKDIDAAALESTDTALATKTMDDTVNQLLGMPTGEQVPDILRSLSVVGGAVNLANSGVYQIADAGLMLQQFGVVKTFKALTGTKFGRDAIELAKSPEYGARLQDVLEARNVLSGKYRSVLTHLEDNHDIGSLGLTHQFIQHAGQGTRFANGMEFIRRGQSKMVAGLVADTVEDAIKGNPKAAEAMARFGLNDTILNKLKVLPSDMRKWPDDLRLDMETIGQNMADSIVLENRLGEIPGWMQFSAVGKVVLPYMTFVAGAWNKILRRTYAMDGTAGVAMALAYQTPLTVLSSAAAMGMAGQQVTPEKLAAKVATQIPLMSWLGFGVDFATNGPTNSIAALSIIDKMYSASSGIAKGDVDPATVIKAVPFIGIVPGMRLLGTSLSDDDE